MAPTMAMITEAMALMIELMPRPIAEKIEPFEITLEHLLTSRGMGGSYHDDLVCG